MKLRKHCKCACAGLAMWVITRHSAMLLLHTVLTAPSVLAPHLKHRYMCCLGRPIRVHDVMLWLAG